MFRQLSAIALAVVAPLAALYMTGIALGDADLRWDSELDRMAFLALPALIVAVPLALAQWPVWRWLLRRATGRRWLTFAAGALATGLVAGAIVALLSAPRAPIVVAGLIAGASVIAAITFAAITRATSG